MDSKPVDRLTDDRKTRIKTICRELVELVGLRQGHVEIHCHKGQPRQVVVIDKSLKLDDEDEKPTR